MGPQVRSLVEVVEEALVAAGKQTEAAWGPLVLSGSASSMEVAPCMLASLTERLSKNRFCAEG